MDLVDDDEAYEVRVASVRALARDGVPFLWCCDNDLSLGNLLLDHLRLASKFTDCDAEDIETIVESSDHLLHQGFHQDNVDNLGVVQNELARGFARSSMTTLVYR